MPPWRVHTEKGVSALRHEWADVNTSVEHLCKAQLLPSTQVCAPTWPSPCCYTSCEHLGPDHIRHRLDSTKLVQATSSHFTFILGSALQSRLFPSLHLLLGIFWLDCLGSSSLNPKRPGVNPDTARGTEPKAHFCKPGSATTDHTQWV